MEFSYIGIWFTDQSSKPLEIESKRNLNLVINWCDPCKTMRCSSNLGKGYLIGPRDKYSWKVTNLCLPLKI